MLDPSADISFISAWWLEAGIPVTTTIVATPMEMPSADSAARSLRVRRPRSPRPNRSRKASRTGLGRASEFRRLSGLTWPQMIRDGLSLRHGKRHLIWGHVLPTANTPMLLRAAVLEGRTDLGVMASGQVAGAIDDPPSCAELVDRIMRDAVTIIGALPGTSTG